MNAKMVGDSCVVESITTDITITISATQSTYNINIETTDGLKVENKLLICKYGDTPTFQFQYDSIYFKNLTVYGMNAKLLDKKTCRLGPVIANGTITLSATKIQVYERTVVVSVGCTSQESGYSFWPSYEMSVKNAPGYSVYDLDINSNVEARLGTATSAILSLYKTDRSSILEADQNYYLQSCKVLSENVGYEEYLETRNILAFMKSVIDVIKNRENPTRIVFIYRGHGGGGAFFEGSLSKVDIGTLLEYTKSTLNNPEVVLDFSTTCGEGAVETLIPICKNSDYLIASELSVGFFGSIIGTSYYGFKNDYHKIWGTDNSTQVALNQEFDSFKHYWSEGVDYITRFGYKESRVLYKCSMFEQLMKTLAVDEGYYSILSNPENQSNNYDIGYYAYKSSNPGLVAVFEACRTKYLTTSYILPFDKNTRGLSVMNYYLFDIYLRSLRSTT